MERVGAGFPLEYGRGVKRADAAGFEGDFAPELKGSGCGVVCCRNEDGAVWIGEERDFRQKEDCQ